VYCLSQERGSTQKSPFIFWSFQQGSQNQLTKENVHHKKQPVEIKENIISPLTRGDLSLAKIAKL
jgi:hypothetical protein